MQSIEQPRIGAIVIRAMVYALAAATLVLFTPSAAHIFIYQGF